MCAPYVRRLPAHRARARLFGAALGCIFVLLIQWLA